MLPLTHYCGTIAPDKQQTLGSFSRQPCTCVRPCLFPPSVHSPSFLTTVCLMRAQRAACFAMLAERDRPSLKFNMHFGTLAHNHSATTDICYCNCLLKPEQHAESPARQTHECHISLLSVLLPPQVIRTVEVLHVRLSRVMSSRLSSIPPPVVYPLGSTGPRIHFDLE